MRQGIFWILELIKESGINSMESQITTNFKYEVILHRRKNGQNRERWRIDEI